MSTRNLCRNAILVAATLVFLSGCATHVGVGVGYRSYDPYYRDYHVWDDHERVYYNQ